MHYYQFNIGDYRSDTAHLSLLEHGVYRQLIDWYYLDEKPIPRETQAVYRRLSARTQDEKTAVDIVLSEFFIETDDGYSHGRISKEVAEYAKRCDHNRQVGKLGGRPKKTDMDKTGNPEETQVVYKNNPDQEPLTKNQEPRTSTKKNIDPPTKFNAAAYLVLNGADQQIVDDWIKLRKLKKAAVTQTAIEGIKREAKKAGIDLTGALRICCERGWSGFKAEWLISQRTQDRRNSGGNERHERLAEHTAILTGRHRQQQPEDDPAVIHGTAERLD